MGVVGDLNFEETGKLMAQHIPNSKLIEYEWIGLMATIEAPGRLARDIQALLSR